MQIAQTGLLCASIRCIIASSGQNASDVVQKPTESETKVFRPRTFGSGYQVEISTDEFELLNHTLSADATAGVLSHFWMTGSNSELVDSAIVSLYVDGEAAPSIRTTLSMACGQGYPDVQASTFPPQGLFAAGSRFGKSAAIGGWHFEHPVPFYRSLRVTLPSGAQLPLGTKMQLQQLHNQTFQPLSFVPIAKVPQGLAGLLYMTVIATSASHAGNYIEGCFHLFPSHDAAWPGIVVGTGVEDFYSSSYRFCAHGDSDPPCTFAHPDSGMLAFSADAANDRERISAYRVLVDEEVGFMDGGSLQWRVGDVKDKCLANGTSPAIGHPTATNVTSDAWVLVWPNT